MRRSSSGTVLGALVTVALLVGCGGESADESQSGAPPAEETTTPAENTATPEESAATTDATQTEPDQPVSDALIERLIVEANDAGYGPADESFALLMVDTCRDVDSKYSSWDELIDQDVADGAPRADAEAFYEFLRDEFCPAVEPLKETEQPEGDEDVAGDGTRGLGSRVSRLDAVWKHGTLEKCRAATGAPLGEPRAYAFGPGVLVCTDYLKGGHWGETLIGLDAVFEPAVSEADARAVALRLLPKDASFVDRFKHTNPGWAARQGSCVSLVFESATLEDAIRAADPDWSDAGAATATLYSDKQTDYGSGSAFDGTAQVMSLSLGGDSSESNC